MRNRQVGGDHGRALNLGDDVQQQGLVEKSRTRAQRGGKGLPLRLRNWDRGVRKKAFPALRLQKGRPCGSGTGLLRHRSRHRGQSCVEQGWVGGLKAVTLQHRKYSGHHPKGRRSHLQPIPEHSLHLRKGDGAPSLGPNSFGPCELCKRRIDRL